MHSFNLLRFRNATVKSLIGWRRCEDEEKWVKKAIEILYKKIKHKKGSVENLQYALANPGSPSNCVTIPRSADGRLQVSNRKSLPHLIYCKVWRWPDLQSHHEIKPVETCSHPFSKRDSEVCVNPYHYERIQKPALPPVYVPNFSEETQVSLQEVLPNQQQYFYSHSNSSEINGSNDYDVQMETEQPAYDYPSPQYSTNSSPTNSLPLPQKYRVPPVETPPPDYKGDITKQNLTPVSYEETSHWASIAYYELNQRVGEIFHVKSPSVQVDGFTKPYSSDRFSLGLLSNIHRNSTIENTRKYIGRGLCMWYIGGEIFLECLSEYAVFVNSHCLNNMNNLCETSVIKLTKGSPIKVFSEQVFASLLIQGVERGYEYVYSLIKYGFLRISFIKGWGKQYHRVDITSTPSWIEVQIFGALKWLDKVLIQMGSPTNTVSSLS